jgi:NAD(P) transhydrogenase subunit alpha
MSEGVALLTIFVLSAFTGYEVISKVSTILHTPLMSTANAISGLILVGAILIAGRAETLVELVVGLIAVALASINLVGGFVVTDRMLDMFRGRRRPAAAVAGNGGSPTAQGETTEDHVRADTDADGPEEPGQSGAERHG